MEFFQVQGGLPRYDFKSRVFKLRSLMVIFAIFMMHAFLIYLAVYENSRQRAFLEEESLRMINVLPEHEKLLAEPLEPEIQLRKPPQLDLQSFQIVEEIVSRVHIKLDDAPYELTDKSAKKYGNLFDPKLRKKLIEAEPFNRVLQGSSLKSWRLSGGQVVDEIGDGQCMTSVQSTNTRDRGTTYATFKCGPSDSEKAMERVMADYESHRSKP